jgi:hypothetical protein
VFLRKRYRGEYRGEKGDDAARGRRDCTMRSLIICALRQAKLECSNRG